MENIVEMPHERRERPVQIIDEHSPHPTVLKFIPSNAEESCKVFDARRNELNFEMTVVLDKGVTYNPTKGYCFQIRICLTPLHDSPNCHLELGYQDFPRIEHWKLTYCISRNDNRDIEMDSLRSSSKEPVFHEPLYIGSLTPRVTSNIVIDDLHFDVDTLRRQGANGIPQSFLVTVRLIACADNRARTVKAFESEHFIFKEPRCRLVYVTPHSRPSNRQSNVQILPDTARLLPFTLERGSSHEQLYDANFHQLKRYEMSVDVCNGIRYSDDDQCFVSSRTRLFKITVRVKNNNGSDTEFLMRGGQLTRIGVCQLWCKAIKDDNSKKEVALKIRTRTAPFPILNARPMKMEEPLPLRSVHTSVASRLFFDKNTENHEHINGLPNPNQTFFRLHVFLRVYTEARRDEVALLSYLSDRIKVID